MNDTVILPERRRDTGDLLRNIMDGLIPVLLTAVIISLILFRVDVTEKFAQTALTVQTTACAAVKASNDANYNLWSRQILASKDVRSDPAKREAADKFLADLKATNGAIFAKCESTLGTASVR